MSKKDLITKFLYFLRYPIGVEDRSSVGGRHRWYIVKHYGVNSGEEVVGRVVSFF